MTIPTLPRLVSAERRARVGRWLQRLSAGLVFIVACATGWSCAAQAQQNEPAPGYNGEYIDSFRVHFDIRPDGTLEVEETIRVYVKGEAIKRGIYRAFPNDRREAYQTSTLPIANLRVQRNGAPESIGKDELTTRFYTAYFGQSDRRLPTNQFHTYTLNYTVPKAVYQFEDSDNFDWNVIGHDGEFAIRTWEVTVTYPADAIMIDDSAFTGVRGTETATKLDQVTHSPGQVVLSGTRLLPFEGVTYVLRFDPALISPRDGYPVINQAYFDELERKRLAAQEAERIRQEQEAQRRAEEQADRTAEAQRMLPVSLVVLLIFLVLWLLVVALWSRIGRQKTAMPVVVPQFYAPSFIGPAASRYINRMGNINPTKLLVTGIVSLAVKGSVRLENKIIERISAKESNLTAAEIGILNDLNLSLTKKTFDMKVRSESKAKRLKTAGKNLVKRLKDEYRNTYRTNWLWLVVLLILINLTWLGAALLTASYVIAFQWLLSVLSIVSGLLFLRAGQNLLSMRTLLFTLANIGIVYMSVNWVPLADHPFYLPLHLCFVVSATLVYFVRVHISNFSQVGGEIVAQLRGLEMYIKAAERGTLKDEPTPNFDHFSAIYPFAFALGLHTVWANKFSQELEMWAADEQFRNDLWYTSNYFGFEDTLDQFEDRFSSTMSYSSPSSSGSGGSSFSGGGGGGGGGGGW